MYLFEVYSSVILNLQSIPRTYNCRNQFPFPFAIQFLLWFLKQKNAMINIHNAMYVSKGGYWLFFEVIGTYQSTFKETLFLSSPGSVMWRQTEWRLRFIVTTETVRELFLLGALHNGGSFVLFGGSRSLMTTWGTLGKNLYHVHQGLENLSFYKWNHIQLSHQHTTFVILLLFDVYEVVWNRDIDNSISFFGETYATVYSILTWMVRLCVSWLEDVKDPRAEEFLSQNKTLKMGVE